MATKKAKSKKTAGNAAVEKSTAAKAKAKPRKRKPAKPAVEEERDRCFVISPFGGWHDDYYDAIFCPAIKAAGLTPTRADDLFRSSNIVHDIWHKVVSSRVVLADLTGRNPNVFYELGLAHAIQKPVLLLTQSIEEVPFDLRALRVIEYEVEHPKWGDVLRENIKVGLLETLESPEQSVLPTLVLEKPGEPPEVSGDDARLIALQQQVDSLQSEVRANRPSRSRSQLPRREAEGLIDAFLDQGMGPGKILRRVTEMGAPELWVERRIDDRLAERKL